MAFKTELTFGVNAPSSTLVKVSAERKGVLFQTF